MSQYRLRGLRRCLHPPAGRRQETGAEREDVPGLPPPARRQVDRRGDHRHAAASALRVLRRGHAAGKHVYQEKTMAFTVDHAKRMRAAYQSGRNRSCRSDISAVPPARCAMRSTFLKTGNVGKITAIHAHMYRNTPHGKPQWARPVYPDMTPENIAWNSFLGERRTARFRRQPLHQLALLLGLLRRQRLREHVPSARVLVQGD